MMYKSLPTSIFLLTSSTYASPIGHAVAGPMSIPRTEQGTKELISSLLTQATAVERYKLLSPADFAYDFKNPPPGATTTGKGGHTVKADGATFPALIGNGVAMTVGFIGPCGFNTPHIHPRSAEFNIVVKGALHAQFIAENGATAVSHDAGEFQSVIFPQGAMHTEFNPTCEESIFVAGFGNTDPGVQQVAQTFFALDDDIVLAATTAEWFAGHQLQEVRKSLPANVALGVEKCLKKCGISAM